MNRSLNLLLASLICALSFSPALAQRPDGPPPGPEGPGMGGPPPMEHVFHDRHFGRWWRDPQLAQQLGLSGQQKQQMDQIFLQHRLKLIDLNANLEKQEVLLRPMIEADQPDETKILAQIDTVAQARADLEKADARMLFDIRKTLTPEQWQKLKSMRMEHRDRDRMRHDRDGDWARGHRHPMGQNGGPPPPAQPDAQPQGQAPAPPQ